MESVFVILNENNQIIRTSDQESVIDEQLKLLTESGQKVKKKQNILS